MAKGTGEYGRHRAKPAVGSQKESRAGKKRNVLRDYGKTTKLAGKFIDLTIKHSSGLVIIGTVKKDSPIAKANKTTLKVKSLGPLPVARATAHSLRELRGFTDDEIYTLVVPKRTLARRESKNELLTVEETDKALRLDRTVKLAEKVFGDADKAGRWLRRPKQMLNGETPLAYLASESGARKVEDMLNQIDFGILP